MANIERQNWTTVCNRPKKKARSIKNILRTIYHPALYINMNVTIKTVSFAGRKIAFIHVALFPGAGLSQNDKQLILDMHNAMRQSIALGQVGGQPPATNMMEMVSRKSAGTWARRRLPLRDCEGVDKKNRRVRFTSFIFR